jgi:hypothetical protein
MFSASGLVPSTVVQKCITVTYNGTVSPYPAIKLYAKSPPTTSSGTNLATYLNLTVEMGTGTSDAAANCTSFSTPTTIYPTNTLANFASSYPSYATSLATWTPTASPSPRTFRFTIQVQDTTAAQGLNTTFGFQWETQAS